MDILFVAGRERGVVGSAGLHPFCAATCPSQAQGEALVARKGYTALSAGQKW